METDTQTQARQSAITRGLTYFFETVAHGFDSVHAFWEGEVTSRRLATAIVVVFLGSLAAIEMNRWGLFPASIARVVPTNHFYAVNMAFTLLLLQEVMQLVLTLPRSFSRAVGKQFEILALILLRSCFKELVNIHEPLVFPQDMTPLLRILSDGMGALVVFVLLTVFIRVGKARKVHHDGAGLYAFVLTKKALSLLLLALFAVLGAYNLWLGVSGAEMFDFFTVFYTVLIFSDIFIVLVAQRHLPGFVAMFRNSGLALSTVFIRLALVAPPYYNAAMGVASALFAIMISLAYNYYMTGRLIAKRRR
ncbi:hypothetical protein ACI3L3_05690 [Desulfobaculum sp. SPO524]|uniref:hypothetical protein n=1 Tax=Desulfobaculum sp. SPO524 TaxID=3378071 RepID=UPI00385259BD